jgi:integrase
MKLTSKRVEYKLTSKRVTKALKRAGKYPDGHGLVLVVKNVNNANWNLRYQRDGRERWYGLGPVHTISLGEARTKARRARQQLLDGTDPIEARKEAKAQRALAAAKALTFVEASRRFLDQHSAKWENARHREQWSTTLKTYAEPIIGRLPVSKIDVPLVLAVLEQSIKGNHRYPGGPFWHVRPETANRLRGRIEQILDWCKARGHRTGDNPASWDVIGKVLPARGPQQHHAALPYKDIPSFMGELRQRQGTAARALEFLIHTSARAQEAIEARWSELDLDAGVWELPSSRMKMRQPHRVPLTPQVCELLRALPREGDYVFIGAKAGQPINYRLVVLLLKSIRSDATAHGMRSTFRDWAGESTAFPHDVCEAALAHIKGKTERAYQRGDLFEKRRGLMVAWSKYCSSPPVVSADVVPIRQ